MVHMNTKVISNDFSMLGELGKVEDEGITKWLAWDYISQLKTLKNWKVFETLSIYKLGL